jgi:two-component system sensor histidine kinase KdpD
VLAAVSHDLRSPIAAVKAASSSLRSHEVTWSADDQAELLAAIEDGADRLTALVDNLLDLSRLQLGVVNPLLTEVDLSVAVTWVLASSPAADRVTVRLHPQLPTAAADPGLLDRVLSNLVDNALRYTPEDREIAIEAHSDAQQVSLRVVDHGPGVRRDQQQAMFEPFQRLGDVPAGDGLGLELAAARGLAEAMNATLTAADTPGGGLTMTLSLPLSDPIERSR